MEKETIYISHSSISNYVDDLYLPLSKSKISKKYKLFFPHKPNAIFEAIPSEMIIKNCSFVIAEVSYSTLGVGIEIGWAHIFGKPIICIYKKGTRLSYSLDLLNDLVKIEYISESDLIVELEKYLL